MSTRRMVAWLLVISFGLTGLILLTGAQEKVLHFAVAALVALGFAASAQYDNIKLARANATEAEFASMNARYMGAVWFWGALVITILYTLYLDWHEWWRFVAGFSAASIVSFIFANTLSSNPEARIFSTTNLKVARIFAWVQLVAMAVTAIGLIADNKMDSIGLNYATRSNPPEDWAANHIFFSGAIALVLISWLALSVGKRFSSPTS